MINDENKKVVEQLEKLDSLLNECFELSDYIEGGCAVEYSEKISREIKKVEKLPCVPSVFECIPTFPKGYNEMLNLKNIYNGKKRLFTGLLIASIAAVVLYFISHNDILNTISSGLIIISIIYIFVFLSSKSKYIAAEKEYNKSLEQSNESISLFEYAMTKYEKEKANGISAAKEFKEKYLDAYKKYLALADEYAEAKNKSMEKFVSNMEEARKIDFVPEEYYPLVKSMISMLKSGRAENYKEALNMAIQEKREAKAEAERRAEEARRTQILQEQAEAQLRRDMELERHNKEMENQQILQAKYAAEEQRKFQNDMRAQQQKAQHEAELANFKTDREARNQANRVKSAGITKCANCANSRNCPTSVKNSGAGLNCGGYVPYGSK